MKVDVAGRDGRHAEARGETGERAVAGTVGARIGPLQLDPEAVAAEGLEQSPGESGGLGALSALEPSREDTLGRAARQAHQPLGVPEHPLERDPRSARLPPRTVAGVGVGGGEETAEVAVAGGVLDQQGQVGELRQVGVLTLQDDGELGAGDRPHPDPLAGVRELHRATETVVVGQRQRRIAELGGTGGQLERRRGAVEEGEGRVAVELDVGGGGHQDGWRNQPPVSRSQKTTTSRPSARTSSQ